MEDKSKNKELPISAIEVSGVVVTSQKANLKEIEQVVDRIITKHKDFLLLRKEMKLKTPSYMD